jgi:hypothetical protein
MKNSSRLHYLPIVLASLLPLYGTGCAASEESVVDEADLKGGYRIKYEEGFQAAMFEGQPAFAAGLNIPNEIVFKITSANGTPIQAFDGPVSLVGSSDCGAFFHMEAKVSADGTLRAPMGKELLDGDYDFHRCSMRLVAEFQAKGAKRTGVAYSILRLDYPGEDRCVGMSRRGAPTLLASEPQNTSVRDNGSGCSGGSAMISAQLSKITGTTKLIALEVMTNGGRRAGIAPADIEPLLGAEAHAFVVLEPYHGKGFLHLRATGVRKEGLNTVFTFDLPEPVELPHAYNIGIQYKSKWESSISTSVLTDVLVR